jgi:hypothetical protein
VSFPFGAVVPLMVFNATMLGLQISYVKRRLGRGEKAKELGDQGRKAFEEFVVTEVDGVILALSKSKELYTPSYYTEGPGERFKSRVAQAAGRIAHLAERLGELEGCTSRVDRTEEAGWLVGIGSCVLSAGAVLWEGLSGCDARWLVCTALLAVAVSWLGLAGLRIRVARVLASAEYTCKRFRERWTQEVP